MCHSCCQGCGQRLGMPSVAWTVPPSRTCFGSLGGSTAHAPSMRLHSARVLHNVALRPLHVVMHNAAAACVVHTSRDLNLISHSYQLYYL